MRAKRNSKLDIFFLSNKHHFDSIIDITFKIHDSNQKVLNTLYVQFCEDILDFERAFMVQPSGKFFFRHPVYCVECSNKKIYLSATSITKNNFHNNVF